MINKNDLDHIFKESFSDFKATPSTNVWAGIETQLIVSNKQLRKNKGRKIFLFSLLGILFLGSTLYSLMPFNTHAVLTNDTQQLSNTSIHKEISAHKQTTDTPQHNELQNNTYKAPLTEEVPPQYKSFNTEKNISQSKQKNVKTDNKSVDLTRQNSLPKQENNYKRGDIVSTSKKSYFTSSQVENISNKSNNNVINSIEETGHTQPSARPFLSINNNRLTNNEWIQAISTLDAKTINRLKTERSELDIMSSVGPIEITPSQHTSYSHRLTFQAIYQYNHSYRSITGQGKEFFEQRERQGYASSYGLRANLKINHSWSMQSGLDLQNLSLYRDKMVISKYIGNNQSETLLSTSFNTNKALFTLRNSDHLNVGELISISGVFKQETKWLNIPINLVYHIKKKNFAFDLSTGVSTSLFLSDRITFKENQHKTLDFKHTFSESSSQTYLSYNGAITIHYIPHSSFDLFIGFHYQNAFTSATKSKTIKYFPYLYGIQAGGSIPIF